MICEIFFFPNSAVYYLFFIFYLFLTFYFQFRLSKLVTKMLEIFMFFVFYGLENFSKNFGKPWNIFQKNRDI